MVTLLPRELIHVVHTVIFTHDIILFTDHIILFVYKHGKDQLSYTHLAEESLAKMLWKFDLR